MKKLHGQKNLRKLLWAASHIGTGWYRPDYQSSRAYLATIILFDNFRRFSFLPTKK